MKRLASLIFFGGLGLAVCFAGCGGNEDDSGGIGNGSGGSGNKTGSGGTGTGGIIIGTGGSGNGGNVGGGTSKCENVVVDGKLQPPVIELVIDTSGSMATGTDGGQNPPAGQDKWSLTKAAIIDAFAKLPDGSAWIGASNFPAGNRACGGASILNIANLNDGQRNALKTALDRLRPQNSTPTHGGLRHGITKVRGFTQYDGPKYTLLITDGQPTVDINCNQCTGGQNCMVDPAPIIQEAADAYAETDPAKHVGTFVMGSPGSEPGLSALSKIAIAGGTPQPDCDMSGNSATWCHIDMTNAKTDLPTVLAEAIKKIVTTSLSCTFPINPPDNAEPSKASVFYIHGGQKILIPHAPNDTCGQGWTLTVTADKKKFISLCPDWCDRAKADDKSGEAPKISIEIPCKIGVF